MGAISQFKGGCQNKFGKETRGCRWTPIQIPNKMFSLSTYQISFALDWRMQMRFGTQATVDSEEKFWPSRPPCRGWFFDTAYPRRH